MNFILGISITLNIISLISFFIIYKYSLKGIKKNIENYVLSNFLDDDVLNEKFLGGLYDNKQSS